MPVEDMWASFFNIDRILSELQINSNVVTLAEVGCGYGTFTIPSARIIKGILYAFDLEKEMLDIVRQKLTSEHIHNVNLDQRDVLTQRTGLADNSIDYVMLFNILHHHSPNVFLNEAYRILKPHGKIGVLHWRSDIETPRGPDLSIRPKPEQILHWIDRKKFFIDIEPIVLEPFHFGLVLSKQ